ncbi:endonuclease/exonuclease/phosphatase family metal-dependent hydrolase [Enterococcus sp. PF1-24]|uniref:endonuclease/exonuclease/phosphatase family protein n=1 Tax=unclassified Enterococcus TaxID=2608891 RepID=UPI002472FD2C|nr:MULTISPECIES: endonuclease/exonuclease/phosphatase family protein [unclassified Enterococcus]MDH6365508.1 endonuclease/exonuclease/phosphatase family metal-dependent hydrolase [Enterococcus sp. PFB1-1]MDH6402609.1 endonuclease/exonuclease/phosphatase family metal-dependent hydrolase [Enterococcus sp. PF1-24]
MKRKYGLLFSIALAFLTGCSQAATNDSATSATNTATSSSEVVAQDAENQLVVGTFNIDIKAPEIDVNQQRKLLEDAGVEIFGIQEVDQNTYRYEERAGYDPFVDFEKGPYTDSYFGMSIAIGDGGYGNGIVSEYPLKDESVTVLYGVETAPEDLQAELYDIYKASDYRNEDSMAGMMKVWGADGLVTKGAIEPRSYSRAVIEKDDKEIAFYTTHLSVESFDIRTKQLEQLKETLDADPIEYKVIVGDFNTDYGINEFNIFADNGYNIANGHDGVWYETMAEKDSARESLDTSMTVKFLDNIIVSDNMEVLDVEVIKTDLSDHYPLVAKFALN